MGSASQDFFIFYFWNGIHNIFSVHKSQCKSFVYTTMQITQIYKIHFKNQAPTRSAGGIWSRSPTHRDMSLYRIPSQRHNKRKGQKKKKKNGKCKILHTYPFTQTSNLTNSCSINTHKNQWFSNSPSSLLQNLFPHTKEKKKKKQVKNEESVCGMPCSAGHSIEQHLHIGGAL